MASITTIPKNTKDSIYKIIDQVIKTGTPAMVERKGKRLLISPIKADSKLDQLDEHPGFIICDPEDIVHMDWSTAWEPDL